MVLYKPGVAQSETSPQASHGMVLCCAPLAMCRVQEGSTADIGLLPGGKQSGCWSGEPPVVHILFASLGCAGACGVCRTAEHEEVFDPLSEGSRGVQGVLCLEHDSIVALLNCMYCRSGSGISQSCPVGSCL